MAKAKNKKKNFSEQINNKKKLKNVKSMNPFEVHINREKMKVLGRKLKNDRGLPGVSKAKAIKRRQNTLLQEYKVLNKSNKFLDKRIGERNYGLTEEDRAMARFTAVRARAHKRKSIFNLADDEVLTHRGQTLHEIEKFDDPRSEDEESVNGEQSSGKLEADFVKDAHFGGGILSKTGIQGAKSHKDLINQLIAESKKRKAEKQQTKEKTLELTEKLDTEWKDLIPIVNKNVKRANDPVINTEMDSYDKVMRELRFEARGHPSDKLKSEEEVAKEEKEKLEQLEKERLSRMKGFFQEKKETVMNHRSADDLDDDFAYDSDPDVMLSYNDKGESNVPLVTKENSNMDNEQMEEEESEEEIETESEDDLSDLKAESSDSEDENTDDNPEKTQENTTKIHGTNDSSEETQEKTKTDENSEENVMKTIENHQQAKTNENRQQNKTETNSNPQETKTKINESCQHNETKTNDNNEENKTKTSETDEIKTDLLRRKLMMEQARKELPYTFPLPESYEDLQNTLKNKSGGHQSVIIERMVKCNHPSLNAGNKDKLGMLFVYLLQHINDFSDEANSFETFYCLVPQLFELAQLNQENAQRSVAEVIKEKQLQYRKSKKSYPDVDVLLFLKLVGCLFPTSDFRHSVVTPSIVFVDQMLNKCRVLTGRDITYGLFLVTLILEYTSLSKRYLPSAMNYLAGILHMAIPKSGVKLIKIPPPFRTLSHTLVLFKNCSALQMSLKLEPSDFWRKEIGEDFKIRSLYVALKLLLEFSDNFRDLSSNCEIFQRSLNYLQQIPVPNYPTEVQNEIEHVMDSLEKFKRERTLNYVVMEMRKPKALRLYEPNVQKIFDTKKHKVMSKEKAERAKLLHKIKRERKGALREIRKDKAFLGKIKINEKIQSDRERREKVKRIFSEASIQQSELNSMDRKNKRKK